MWLIAYTLAVLHIRGMHCYDHVTTGCWPNNVIPFKIGRGFTYGQVSFIRDQIEQFNRMTCVRWVNVQNVQINQTEYVGFQKSIDKYACRSVKGFLADGSQGVYIELGQYCFIKQVLMHEMMHVLGFPHEQQRADRDCYVMVNHEKVDKLGQTGRFATRHIPWLERFPYDKTSIMHYPRTTVMKARTERWYNVEPLGNQEGEMSFLDLWKLMYKFCGLPHYCDVFPEICVFMDEVEKSCTRLLP